MRAYAKKLAPIVAVGLLASACSRKIQLPDEHRHRYACNTSMPLADGKSLRQEFSVDLNAQDMTIKLKQSGAGDASLETYPYTLISDQQIQGINTRGLVAIFKTKPASLKMKMNDSSASISGACRMAGE